MNVLQVWSSGIITTAVGTLRSCGYTGDGWPATTAKLSYPSGVALSSWGDLYIADFSNNAIRQVSAASHNPFCSLLPKLYEPSSLPQFRHLSYIFTHTLKVNSIGIISTLAGGKKGYSGDGASATAATLNLPDGVAVASWGDVFIADTHNHCVRKVKFIIS